jgi:hypothetical protein
VADVTAIVAAAAAVVGDGTTAKARARRRWRRWRPLVVVLAVLLAGALLAVLPAPRTSTTPLAPDNVGKNGGRALAEILGRHGVTVVYVRTLGDAERAVAGGGTLLVLGDYALSPSDAGRIAATRGDLVLVAATGWLDVLAPGVAAGPDSGSVPGTRQADCTDEDAVAAGSIVATGALVAAGPGTVVCFPAATGGPGAYAVTTNHGRRVAVLADATPLTNAALADEGNAALAIRMLGRHDRLVWYLPTLGAVDGSAGPTAADLLPPWARVLGLEALLVVLVVALWRGRRLGPVVAERLPVVVPAAETTRGRGRLYRRSRAHAHAAAALRAGAATRMATRLGLPRSAGAAATIDAVARATAMPADEVLRLLYGPPPTDDRTLAALADELNILESEVHRS